MENDNNQTNIKEVENILHQKNINIKQIIAHTILKKIK